MTNRKMKNALKKIRTSTASTHWIKGHYRCWVNPDNPRQGSEFTPMSDANKKLFSKECFCLAGLINNQVGLSPSEIGADILIGVGEPYLDYRPLDVQEKRKEAIALGKAIWTSIRILHPRSRAANIEEWNDRKDRTRDDVLAVLDHAISSL